MHFGTEREIVEALKVITRRLRDAKIEWVLGGSTSLALQGVDISPKDIDILTDKDGAFEINKLLKEYEVKPVEFKTSDLFESFFGEFRILNVKVEVMGNLREKHGSQWVSLSTRLKSVKLIEMNGMEIPVSSLHEQKRAYEELGRKKDAIRVRKIKEALERQRLG